MRVGFKTKLLGVSCLLAMMVAPALHAQPRAKHKIAFCAWGPQGFDLGVSDAEGKLRMLTKNHFSLFPYFSPDGKSLFFTKLEKSSFGKIFQIFRIDLNTQQMVRISDDSANDEYPVCSPDGKRLAFISRPADPALKDVRYRIYLSDLAGKNREAMDLGDETPELYPTWSPDSDKIAYCYLKFPWSSLKVYDLKKKTTVNLVPFYFYPMEASWSPKGDLIAFTSWNPLNKTYSLWVVKADGSDRYQLTEGPDDRQPFWFPDGRRLVFTRTDGKEKDSKQRGIYIINLKTRKITRLISIKGNQFLYPRIVSVH